MYYERSREYLLLVALLILFIIIFFKGNAKGYDRHIDNFRYAEVYCNGIDFNVTRNDKLCNELQSFYENYLSLQMQYNYIGDLRANEYK